MAVDYTERTDNLRPVFTCHDALPWDGWYHHKPETPPNIRPASDVSIHEGRATLYYNLLETEYVYPDEWCRGEVPEQPDIKEIQPAEFGSTIMRRLPDVDPEGYEAAKQRAQVFYCLSHPIKGIDSDEELMELISAGNGTKECPWRNIYTAYEQLSCNLSMEYKAICTSASLPVVLYVDGEIDYTYSDVRRFNGTAEGLYTVTVKWGWDYVSYGHEQPSSESGCHLTFSAQGTQYMLGQVHSIEGFDLNILLEADYGKPWVYTGAQYIHKCNIKCRGCGDLYLTTVCECAIDITEGPIDIRVDNIVKSDIKIDIRSSTEMSSIGTAMMYSTNVEGPVDLWATAAYGCVFTCYKSHTKDTTLNDSVRYDIGGLYNSKISLSLDSTVGGYGVDCGSYDSGVYNSDIQVSTTDTTHIGGVRMRNASNTKVQADNGSVTLNSCGNCSIRVDGGCDLAGTIYKTVIDLNDAISFAYGLEMSVIGAYYNVASISECTINATVKISGGGSAQGQSPVSTMYILGVLPDANVYGNEIKFKVDAVIEAPKFGLCVQGLPSSLKSKNTVSDAVCFERGLEGDKYYNNYCKECKGQSA